AWLFAGRPGFFAGGLDLATAARLAGARLARTRRRAAYGADKTGFGIVGVGNETALAALALGKLQQTAVEKAQQHPGAREAEHGFLVRRRFDAAGGRLLQVQTVRLDQSL